MLGSQANVADANIGLNTIIADAFEQFANELEGKENLEEAANAIVSRELKAHYRIIFNSDGYSPEWESEALKRGLLNNKNTADAIPVLYEKPNIDVFVRQGVYTTAEAVARADIRLENYIKIINIEALTMIEMAKRDIIPAVSDFIAELCQNVAAKQAVSDKLPCETEKGIIIKLSELNDKASATVVKLETNLKGVPKSNIKKASQDMAHVIIPYMEELRAYVDEMETLTSSDFWPYPTYFDLLYSVK